MSRLDEYAARGLDQYQAACHAAGVDPDTELASARIGRGVDLRVWAAYRLVATAAGIDPAATGISPDARYVANLVTTVRLSDLHGRLDPITVTALLAASGDDQSAWALASTTQDADLLAELAEHPGVTVRWVVAENIATPVLAVERLARDVWPEVRDAAETRLAQERP